MDRLLIPNADPHIRVDITTLTLLAVPRVNLSPPNVSVWVVFPPRTHTAAIPPSMRVESILCARWVTSRVNTAPFSPCPPQICSTMSTTSWIIFRRTPTTTCDKIRRRLCGHPLSSTAPKTPIAWSALSFPLPICRRANLHSMLCLLTLYHRLVRQESHPELWPPRLWSQHWCCWR